MGWDDVGRDRSGRGGRFLQIDPDTTVTVRVLDKEPYTQLVHKISQPINGENVFRSIPATDRLDEDYIEQANKRYAAKPQHNIRVLVLNDAGEPQDIRILSGGVQIFRPLKELYNRHGSLRNFDVEIRREGEGRQTQYHVSAAPHSADIDVQRHIDEMLEDEALDWDNVFPSVTADDQKQLLDEAGLDVYYDPAAEIAEELSVEEAKNHRIPFGKYGPDNYPPEGKTIGEVALIDTGYIEWMADEVTSNDEVAAAARVAVQNLDQISGAKTTKRKQVGDGGSGGAPQGDNADQPVPEDTGDEDSGHPEWPLTMDPGEYVKRYPEGKHADLAREIVGVEESGEAETSNQTTDSSGSNGTAGDFNRNAVIDDINTAFNEQEEFQDALVIVETLKEYGDGKTRVKDFTDSQLRDLHEAVAA